MSNFALIGYTGYDIMSSQNDIHLKTSSLLVHVKFVLKNISDTASISNSLASALNSLNPTSGGKWVAYDNRELTPAFCIMNPHEGAPT